MSANTPLTGALGAIIGYVGAEVVEVSTFERLLWPQRFYNHVTPGTLFLIVIASPSGGPLHKAALHTLDVFRSKGLYRGVQQGHMLGTAFFPDLRTQYLIHNSNAEDEHFEARNGLWVTVLRMTSRSAARPADKAVSGLSDTELKGEQRLPPIRRTTLSFQNLELSLVSDHEVKNSGVRIVTEQGAIWRVILAITVSELGSMVCAAAIISCYRQYWFGAYMFLPLILKLLSLPTSVRRGAHGANHPRHAKDKHRTTLFQIRDPDYGFPFVEGHDDVVRPFFRHIGHPIRQHQRDRLREIAGITLVVAFVLLFPGGLLSMLWLSSPVQAIWLGYQMWTVVLMHVARFAGLHNSGRTEEALAAHLSRDGRVILRTEELGNVLARLTRTAVASVGEGRHRGRRLVEDHAACS